MNDFKLSFPRKNKDIDFCMFNLLNEADVSSCYRNSNILLNGMTLNRIIEILRIFRKLEVSAKILEFDEEGFLTLRLKDVSRRIPVKDIVNLAEKLEMLSKFKGFSTLSAGLNNPTQFSDTKFEVECMYFIAQKPHVIELELSPEVETNTQIKRPDFRYVTKNKTEFFCECKSIASINRIKNSKLVKLSKYLFPQLSSLISNKFRVEIAFKWLPKHWNRNYSEQLALIVKTLVEQRCMEQVELTIGGWQKTYIKLSLLTDKPYFNCLLNLGNKPPKENPTLILGEITDLTSGIKTAIKDALTQLPRNKNCLVFIYSLNQDHANNAIEKIFKSGEKISGLCGVFSCTNTFKYHHNSFAKLNVSEILGCGN